MDSVNNVNARLEALEALQGDKHLFSATFADGSTQVLEAFPLLLAAMNPDTVPIVSISGGRPQDRAFLQTVKAMAENGNAITIS